MVDFFQIALAANYRVHGVDAVLSIEGFEYLIKVIDRTSGVTQTVGDYGVTTIEPQARIQASSLTALGLEPSQLLDQTISFNGNTWEIHNFVERPTPFGGGEVHCTLIASSASVVAIAYTQLQVSMQPLGVVVKIPVEQAGVLLTMQDIAWTLGNLATVTGASINVTPEQLAMGLSTPVSEASIAAGLQDVDFAYTGSSLSVAPAEVSVSAETLAVAFGAPVSYTEIEITPQAVDTWLAGLLVSVSEASLIVGGQSAGFAFNVPVAVGEVSVTAQDLAVQLNNSATVLVDYASISLTPQNNSVGLATGVSEAEISVTSTGAGVTIGATVNNASTEVAGQTISFSAANEVQVGEITVTGQTVASTIAVGVAPAEIAVNAQGAISQVGVTVSYASLEVTSSGAVANIAVAVSAGEISIDAQSFSFVGGEPGITVGVDYASIEITPQSIGLAFKAVASNASFAVTTQSFSAKVKVVAANATLTYSAQTLDTWYGPHLGFWAGGFITSVSSSSAIMRMSFASMGDATSLTGLIANRTQHTGSSSYTHGYAAGGAGLSNVIERFSFLTDSGGADVGDLSQARYELAGCSDLKNSYGWELGGFKTNYTNYIDKHAYASSANSSDVGDLTGVRLGCVGHSSADYGYEAGGETTGGTRINVINRVSYSSGGNATDVGDLVVRKKWPAGCYSNTAGYTFGGDDTGPNPSYATDKYTFASSSNASDIGSIAAQAAGAGASGLIYGFHCNGIASGSGYTGTPDAAIHRLTYASDAQNVSLGSLVTAKYLLSGHQG